MDQILFYFLSATMLLSAILVISSRSPVNSAIFLILVFFFMAGLFVLLNAFFLAAIQVLVYAGAVMVLFLFVIMLLNIRSEENHRLHYFGIAGCLLVSPVLMLELTRMINNDDSLAVCLSNPSAGVGTTREIGLLLFSSHLVPFEIASVLLLIAMIGVILLCKKETKT